MRKPSPLSEKCSGASSFFYRYPLRRYPVLVIPRLGVDSFNDTSRFWEAITLVPILSFAREQLTVSMWSARSGADLCMNTEALLGIRGWLIDCPEWGRLRSWQDGALILDGRHIVDVGDYTPMAKKPRSKPVHWLHHGRHAIFPGLIDLHSHVPQYPAVARGSSDLLPWLRQYIFPLEKEHKGARGRQEADAFFSELLRQGTTCAMLYTAIYEDSAEAAFLAAQRSGLRVVMGKMMMDIGSYGDLLPTKILSVSMHESERLCRRWHGAADGLIAYAFSPRFAVACSENLMRGVAELAQATGAYIQTHLAENLEELEKVKAQHSWAADYTEVYEAYGLLGPKTVFGHGIHLNEREVQAIHASGAAIAHCPTANLFLRSGIMPLDRWTAAGIPLGLGSDVAAGPELNMWRVMRGCIEAQQARSFYERQTRVPSSSDVLHLATQSAANCLGLGSVIGSFDVGKEADLTIMDYRGLLPYRDVPAKIPLSDEDVLSLCIYRGGPEAVVESFVRGRSIYRSTEPELF